MAAISKNLLLNQSAKQITYEDTFSGNSSTRIPIPILTYVWRYDIIMSTNHCCIEPWTRRDDPSTFCLSVSVRLSLSVCRSVYLSIISLCQLACSPARPHARMHARTHATKRSCYIWNYFLQQTFVISAWMITWQLRILTHKQILSSHRFIIAPDSQSSPVYPLGQWHVRVPLVSVQVPPCLQDVLVQKFSER